MTAEANGTAAGEDLDFEGGLTVLTDRAFIDYEGTAYEVDPTTFGFVKSALEQAQQQEGAESGDVTACQKAAEGIEFSQFADELTNDGDVDVDGTPTTKVSGDLNVDGAIDALIQLTEDPACSSQLEAAGPLPLSELEEARGELSKAIKQAHVDIFVGEDDIVRKFATELTIQPPGSSNEKVELAMELSLSGVNEKQSFSAPSNAEAAGRAVQPARRQPAGTAGRQRRRSRRPAGRPHRRYRRLVGRLLVRRRLFAGQQRQRRGEGIHGMPAGGRHPGRPAEVREPAQVASGPRDREPGKAPP